MNYINLTPHDIVLNDGTVYVKTGTVAGVAETHGAVVDGIRHDQLAGVENLPPPKGGATYIVSMPTLMGMRACGSTRSDVVTPITRGPGVRKHPEKGFIISVPGLRTF